MTLFALSIRVCTSAQLGSTQQLSPFRANQGIPCLADEALPRWIGGESNFGPLLLGNTRVW
jgi:hypothetical protein